MKTASYLELKEQVAHPTPVAGCIQVYPHNGRYHVQHADGIRTVLGAPNATNTGLNTWINQSTTTYGENPTGMGINSDGSIGGLAMRVGSAPPTPYRITVRIGVVGRFVANTITTNFGFRDSATGKVFYCLLDGDGATLRAGALDATFPASGWLSLHSITWKNGGDAMFQIEDDGINIYLRGGKSGAFFNMYSVAKAATPKGIFNPDQIFWAAYNEAIPAQQVSHAMTEFYLE